eukprot:1139060-Pelagomonas_calceolata.AAC.6
MTGGNKGKRWPAAEEGLQVCPASTSHAEGCGSQIPDRWPPGQGQNISLLVHLNQCTENNACNPPTTQGQKTQTCTCAAYGRRTGELSRREKGHQGCPCCCCCCLWGGACLPRLPPFPPVELGGGLGGLVKKRKPARMPAHVEPLECGHIQIRKEQFVAGLHALNGSSKAVAACQMDCVPFDTSLP